MRGVLHINLAPNEVASIYLFGSQVYGTNNVDSDFDLFIVLSSEEYFKKYYHESKTSNFKKFDKERFIVNSKKQYTRLVVETLDGEYNVTIYSLPVFKRLIDEHCIWVLFLLNLPKQFIWKQDYFPQVPIRLRKVRESVHVECNRAWHKSQNCFMNNNIEKGKKLIAYTFRYLQYGEDIAQHGKILDITCGNDVHYQVQKIHEENANLSGKQLCKLYSQQFEKIYKERLTNFLMNAPHKNITITEKNWKTDFEDLKKYIKLNSINSLTRDFSVNISIENDRIRLFIDKEDETPFDTYPMINICNDLIVTTDLTPICPAMGRSIPITFTSMHKFGTNQTIKQVNKKNPFITIKIIEKSVDTHRMVLYWDESTWKVILNQNSIENRVIVKESDIIEIFWKIWNEHGYELPHEKGPSYHFDMKNDLFLVHVKKSANMSALVNHIDIAREHKWKYIDFYASCEINVKKIDSEVNIRTVQEFLEVYVPVDVFNNSKIRSFEIIVEKSDSFRLYEFFMPFYNAVSHLKWFCYDFAMYCEYPSVDSLPQEIQDFVLDYIRFGVSTDFSVCLAVDSAIVNGFENVKLEGNSLEMIIGCFNKMYEEFVVAMKVLCVVYYAVEEGGVDNFEENIIKLLQKYGTVVTSQDLVVKILGTACFTINRLKTRSDVKTEILRLVQTGQDVKKVKSLIGSLLEHKFLLNQ